MEIGLLLLICTAFIVWASCNRANIEAKYIKESNEPLGVVWHVQMWFSGKLGAGLLCVISYGLATGVYGAIAMGFYAMFLYWLCFDFFLNFERCLPAWYISQGKETALSDKLLHWVQHRFSMSEKQAHLAVKIPLILLAFVSCILVAF